MSERRTLRIALPGLRHWLRAARESGIDIQAGDLGWLAARAVRHVPVAEPWREWLLAVVSEGRGLLAAYPAGPCVRALQIGVRPEGCWAVAQPVHLETAIDHLRLARPADVPLTREESLLLRADIDTHLRGTPYSLQFVDTYVWALRCASPLDVRTHDPDEAVGRSIRDFLPEGPAAAAVRSLSNEIQMLLHEHPVNERRARAGQPTVNSLWLWGFGEARDGPSCSLPPLASDDAWLRGLWRILGAEIRTAGLVADARDSTLVAIGSATPVDGPGVPAAAERSVLREVYRALASGRARACTLLAGNVEMRFDALARWRFWRRDARLGESLA